MPVRGVSGLRPFGDQFPELLDKAVFSGHVWTAKTAVGLWGPEVNGEMICGKVE